jgi:hypothetical protein
MQMADLPKPKSVLREERRKLAKSLRRKKYSFAEIGRMLDPPMSAQNVHRMLGKQK